MSKLYLGHNCCFRIRNDELWVQYSGGAYMNKLGGRNEELKLVPKDIFAICLGLTLPQEIPIPKGTRRWGYEYYCEHPSECIVRVGGDSFSQHRTTHIAVQVKIDVGTSGFIVYTRRPYECLDKHYVCFVNLQKEEAVKILHFIKENGLV